MASVIDTLLISIGLDTKQLEKGRTEAARSAKGISEDYDRQAKAIQAISKDLNSVLTSLTNAFKAFLAGLTVDRLIHITNEITKTNQSLLKLSELTGMPVEQISKWENLTRKFGGTAEDADTMVTKVFDTMNRIQKLGETNVGASLVFASPQAGGLGLDRALLQTKDVNKFLLALADAYSKIPLKERASWRTLINQEWGIPENAILLFTKTSKELNDEAAKLPVITLEEAKRADELQQSFADLEIEIGILEIQIVDHLHKPLKDFFDWLDGILKQSREQGGVEAEDKVRGGKPAPGSTMESVSGAINKGIGTVTEPGNVTAAQSILDYLSGKYTPPKEEPSTPTKPKPTETPSVSGEGGVEPSSKVPGMVEVTTKGGHKMTLDPEYADKFKGFVETLEEAGAPIKSLGSYSPRNIAGTNIPSEHSVGRAIDIDQLDRNVAPVLKAWVDEHPDIWNDALKKYGLHSGEFFRAGGPDFGHVGTVEGVNEPGAKESSWPRTLGTGKVITKQGNMSDDLLDFYNSIGPAGSKDEPNPPEKPVSPQSSISPQLLNLPVMAGLATAAGPTTNNSTNSTTTIQALNISTRAQSDEMNIGRIPNDFSASLVPQQYAYLPDTSLE